MRMLAPILALSLFACTADQSPSENGQAPAVAAKETSVTPEPKNDTPPAHTEVATFGSGCFWCAEAVLEQVDGVVDVVSGFMGGTVADPTYEQVCTGDTGHAEVVKVTFDPSKISYDQLLAWFWQMHDPTQVNRQGNDVGTQYRSVIFYYSDEQRAAAERSKAKLEASGKYLGPIATQIVPAGPFYPADEHHQDYYRSHRSAGYCRYVIAPKLDKLGLDK